ncbi:phosphonate C-P lyase system protein PhnH [Paenibacillus guangzhouensis]|uniref:phosphonate C-P lyase system protein PhnH n=1 Tax=Paenibacillus guangzhouensis TaxID=1473112 RepID=UPI001267501E|nr:phosphonate C-P lyase system protein PhnH [Paenibacillus guangzhouensis]
MSAGVKNAERVHAVQQVYRQVLDAMSRPGKIVQLDAPSFIRRDAADAYVLMLGMMLLDQSVSYEVIGDMSLAEQLQLYTLSRRQPIETCDYVFLATTDAGAQAGVDIASCKRGTFTFPDESATIICCVRQLGAGSEGRKGSVKLTMRGPGIAKEQELLIDGLTGNLLSGWRASNEEFPLGVDWIFVDESGCVACVPRSTKFSWEVA